MVAVDPYQVLGVDVRCSQDDISAAYRTLSQRVHPDRTVGLPEAQRKAATEQMVLLNQAYALIGTPQARSRFDAGPARKSASAPSARPVTPPPVGNRRAPILGVLAGLALLMIGALTIYQVGRSRPAATVPTTAVQETFTIEPFTVVTLPDPPRITATATVAPTTSVPVEPTDAIGVDPVTPLEPLRPTSTAPPSTAPATVLVAGTPGCWFVQVASTPDPNVGVEWARPATIKRRLMNLRPVTG